MNVRNGRYKYTATGLASGTKQTIMAQVVYTYKGKTETARTDPLNLEIE